MPASGDPSMSRKRAIVIACLCALLLVPTLHILQLVWTSVLSPLHAASLVSRAGANVTTSTSSKIKEQQAPPMILPITSSVRNTTGPTTTVPGPDRAIQNNTSAGPVRLSETEVKLKYLSLVYNEQVTDAALFDSLKMIYRNTSVGLPLHMIPCIVFPYGHNCAKFWMRKCGSGRRFGSSQDLTLIAEVNWPSPKNIVGDNEWLEVTRWGMPEGSGYGCFFNVRKGSGVFVNTKRTIVVQNDTDAKIIFQIPPLNTTLVANYCPYAREQGYDTIQIVNSFDFDSNQLIYCTGTCATEPVLKACVKGVEFRTGVNNDKSCECDDNIPLLNCGNLIAPKGKQHICDQKWIENATSISLSSIYGGTKVVKGARGHFGGRLFNSR